MNEVKMLGFMSTKHDFRPQRRHQAIGGSEMEVGD